MSYVLVVDDEETVRKALRRRLEAWGYTVKDVGNAAEALETMALDAATIAVLDVRMPGHDGIWLTKQIRQRWSTTAIIIATGADDFQAVDAKQLGAVDHVLKPFEQELLRQAMAKASKAVEEG